MIPSFWREDGFRRRLKMAHDALPKGASERGETSCCRSGRCCWTGPCELNPLDPPRIAAHLGITEADLFAQYLVVDERLHGPGLRVIPRRKQWPGGVFLTNEETFDADTPCVFLGDDNGCQNHDAKPTGGAFYKCWDPSTHGSPANTVWTEEQVLALDWDGNRWRDDW